MLVTGAGGFIGSHVAERLVREGAEVTAFVRYSSNAHRGWLERSPFVGEMRFHFGDVGDADSVAAAMASVETVMHLAALIAIPYSYEAPRNYVRANVEGTINVLQAARARGQRVVATSTSEVYGTTLYAPIDENHPLQGQSPYSATKIGADKICEAFYRSFDVPVTVCRPFNTFGPRQSARAIIPTIITQLLAGPDLKLGALDPTRDLNYVENTVEAFLVCASKDVAIGGVYNFGSGREISIGDLAEKIAGILGVKPSYIVEDKRKRPEKSEVMRLIASSARAERELGWKPRYDIDQGLERTVAWFRDNLHAYRPGEYVL